MALLEPTLSPNLSIAHVHVHVMHSDELICAGVAAILEHSGYLRVSRRKSPSFDKVDVNIIVTDYESGIDLCVALKHTSSAPCVLMLTPHKTDGAVRRALESGVAGYLPQSCTAQELMLAVHALQDGQRYISDAVAHCVLNSLERIKLTTRETDVLELIAQAYSDKAIARALGIANGTVKTHVKNMLSKLNATTRTHAVVLASNLGLISIESPRV